MCVRSSTEVNRFATSSLISTKVVLMPEERPSIAMSRSAKRLHMITMRIALMPE